MSSFGLEWVTLKYHESCPLNNVISIHLFLPAELVHFHPCDLCVSMWTDDGGALHFQCLGSLRDDAVDVNWNISNDHDTPFVGLRLNSSSLDLHDPTCQGLQDYCRARPGPVPRCPYEDSVGKKRCWSVWDSYVLSIGGHGVVSHGGNRSANQALEGSWGKHCCQAL